MSADSAPHRERAAETRVFGAIAGGTGFAQSADARGDFHDLMDRAARIYRQRYI